ncbi:hypothetical protein NQ314_002264 [Rhamnusium bicolor]|uniref:PiggyBac transposable element-derived protein domain-containing protein n=1 Tax=Rhamnusium bicolor TaxID=1586634 RepID=A0AAV8ZRX4_9CUCU|nr:hypothetical protein NQ314_002264 [Rhamnusium bicolor]
MMVSFSFFKILRFDAADTRNERQKYDKLAPIRAVFDDFVSNCQSAYSPFHYVTIDEKLEAFRGRCGFRQYIPNTPAKYGIKNFALADSKIFYMSNLEVYVGWQPDGSFAVSNSAKDVVKRLCQPIKGSGRNLTVDNGFTSVELLKNLQQYFKISWVLYGKTKKRVASRSRFSLRSSCFIKHVCFHK